MVKILIAAHKPAIYPDCQTFVPIWTGAAAARRAGGQAHYMLAVGKDGIRKLTAAGNDYHSDDFGDNISHLNGKLSELSAVYWAWKNPGLLGDPDHIGLMHYRRWFVFAERELPSLRLDAPRQKLICDLYSDEIIERAVKPGTIFAPRIDPNFGEMGAHFRDAHRSDHLEIATAILNARFPQYAGTTERCMADPAIYFLNMFIMPKAVFQRYCRWLFNILFALEARLAENSAFSRYPRDLGYVGERLTSIFLAHEREQGKDFAEIPVLSFRNGDSENYANNATFKKGASFPFFWKCVFRIGSTFMPTAKSREWWSKLYYSLIYG